MGMLRGAEQGGCPASRQDGEAVTDGGGYRWSGPHLPCLPVLLPADGPPLTWLTSTTWMSRAAMSSIRFCGSSSSSRWEGASQPGCCSLQRSRRPH